MNELENIIEKYKYDYPNICEELEIYLAKNVILNFHENKNSTRIFPNNGSHFIDIYWDDDHDERIYVAFKYLYNLGLINYIEKIYEHEALLSLCVRKNLYTIYEVKKEFKRIIGKEYINVCTDSWNYEIVTELP
jgi:hypothetical protein